MRCPYCSSLGTKVLDKRASGPNLELTRRRRACLKCGRRFTTYEKVQLSNLIVIKKDGRREPFDPAKLRAGIEKACEKRPVTEKQIDRLVNGIESQLRRRKSSEVKSKMIGELVIRKLRRLDQVAYLRFVSVYKEFSKPEDFKVELRRLS